MLSSVLIRADFNLNPLVIYRRGLEIEALEIAGAQFNIQKSSTDSISNLQQALLRLFPPKPPSTAPQEKRTVPFNLKELHLEDVCFHKWIA